MRRLMVIVAVSAVILFVSGSAWAGPTWQHTWTFDDPDAWTEPAGSERGSYDTSGYGQGFYPAAWDTTGTTEYAVDPMDSDNGVMRIRDVDSAPGGFRLWLSESHGMTSDELRQEFQDHMRPHYTPSASVDVYYDPDIHDGTPNNVLFYCYAQEPGTDWYTMTTQTYDGIRIMLGDGQVGSYDNTEWAPLSEGWNSLSMQMTEAGTLNFTLNDSLFYQGDTEYELMANPRWLAFGFYIWEDADMLVDNFTISATAPPPIPEPAGLSLLGMALLGLKRKRRR